jgi:hypothetical protein
VNVTAGSVDGCELKVFRSMEQGAVNFFIGYDFASTSNFPRSDKTTGAGTGSANFEVIKRSYNGSVLYAMTDQATEFVAFSITDPYNITVAGSYDLNNGTPSGQDIEIDTNGTYAYVLTTTDATACTNTLGGARGCELNVLNVSNVSSIINVAGFDAGGAKNSGTQALTMTAASYNNGYLYVTKGGNGTACSNTAGSALGCEVMVFGATSSSPFYLMGFDANGSAGSGISSGSFSDVASNGSYIYTASAANTTACSGVAGSAIGCELKVFNVSSDAILSSGYALSVIGRAIGTSWESLSDRNLKENFLDLGSESLQKILNLKPTQYNFKGDSKVRLGFIAQDVREVLPELVSENSGVLSMDYIGLIAPIVKSIQELNAKYVENPTSTALFLHELNDPNAGTTTDMVVQNGDATTTVQTLSWTGKLFNKLSNWLSSAANGITSIFAKKINAEESICLGKEPNQVCMTKDQLETMMRNSGVLNSSNNTSTTPVSTQIQNTSTATSTGVTNTNSSTSTETVTTNENNASEETPSSTSTNSEQTTNENNTQDSSTTETQTVTDITAPSEVPASN